MARTKRKAVKSSPEKNQKIKVSQRNDDLPPLKDLENYPHVFFPFTQRWILEEKRIIQAIVCKKDWEKKVLNEEIVAKWEKEMEEQSDSFQIMSKKQRRYKWAKKHKEDNEGDETLKKLFKNVVKKLQNIAKSSKPIVEPIDCVLQVDNMIPSEVKKAFLKEIVRLENVKESERDWHPGSQKKVLDLVHPSLYCKVPFKTVVLPNPIKQRGLSMTKWIGIGTSESPIPKKKKQKKDEQEEEKIGKRNWIPSDIHVDEKGKVKFQSYVNNLHPKKDKKLYPILEEILEGFIPLFEKSLSKVVERYEIDEYVDKKMGFKFNRDQKGLGDDEEKDEEKDDDEKPEDIKVAYDEANSKVKTDQYNLKGRDLQVIVKLSNTELSSDHFISKSFEGGNWHLEGLEEDIVATGIYYYTVENISKSELKFRQAVDGDTSEVDGHSYEAYGSSWDGDMVEQFEFKTGLSSGDSLTQELGSITVQEDRCIVFPNYFQHKVEQFSLADDTKPAKRRILVFWLIDPKKDKPSTSTIPPQQKKWLFDLLSEYKVFGTHFPNECLEIILSFMDNLMTLEEAKKYREGLMEEREDGNSFEGVYRQIKYCEH